jgi:phage/plasmid-like protein (TIGR03299 family)
MSKETYEDLNVNTLIGFTDKRGHAWHYRADLQSAEPNHYPGPVPVEAVRRRLFHWDPESWEVYTRKPGPFSLDIAELLAQPDDDAMLAYVLGAAGLRHQENRQAITRPDTELTMGIFTEDYRPHPYDRWLLTTVANILDDELRIGSAGLLKNGAVAWVSVETEDNVRLPEGAEFRPYLLATTSLDGSLSTTFGRKVTNVVCDNTHGTTAPSSSAAGLAAVQPAARPGLPRTRPRDHDPARRLGMDREQGRRHHGYRSPGRGGVATRRPDRAPRTNGPQDCGPRA